MELPNWPPELKPLEWIASAEKDLKTFPTEVKTTVAEALTFARAGEKHADAKVLSHFGDAGVVEVVEIHYAAKYATKKVR